MPELEKIVVVTRRTRLEELLERFVMREQARFYLEHSGVEFGPYEEEQRAHEAALSTLRAALPVGARVQFIERSFLPTFTFGERDLVVTLGQDGLVVNVAKYLSSQPILAFNPDPGRIDGVLLPFRVGDAPLVVREVLQGKGQIRDITMAQAELSDGQTLYAVNDLFIGHRTHQSARYRITHNRRSENHSSSGIIVSTGAGSTGWLSSVLNGAAGVIEAFGGEGAAALREGRRMPWDAPELCFGVREPFVSKASSAGIVWGRIAAGEHLELVSNMPQDGAIFSDGIEADYLTFNSGAVARISVAEKRAHLVVA
ncbi:MAG: sugar kinase [Chloroflexota bacterium]|nr:sugar kinase [Chloroflexota bacterium]